MLNGGNERVNRLAMMMSTNIANMWAGLYFSGRISVLPVHDKF